MKELLASSLRVLAIALVVAGFVVALPLQPVAAQTPERDICTGAGGTWKADKDGNFSCVNPNNARTVTGTIHNVANVLIFIVGAIAVIMLIVGGLRYVTSQGDQSGITSAKNTILYALIGIVIAFASYAIVDFVIKNI